MDSSTVGVGEGVVRADVLNDIGGIGDGATKDERRVDQLTFTISYYDRRWCYS